MRSTDNDIKAMGAAFFAYFVFGLSFIFSKTALNAVSPSTLLSLRFVTAFLLLNLIILVGKKLLHLKGKNIKGLFALALFQPVAYFICESYGIQLTSATFSGVMIATIPLVSMLGGAVFLREKPSVKQVIFLVVSVGGVMLMAMLKSSEGTVTPLGILFMLGAVLSGAAYNALSRSLSGDFTAFERTYVMFLLGCLIFVPFSLWEHDGDVWVIVSCLQYPEVWIPVIFLGVVCSVLAFWGLNYANTYLPLARSTSFSNITTVVSVFAGMIVLKEACNLFTVVAAVAIIIGVWGVQKFSPSRGK